MHLTHSFNDFNPCTSSSLMGTVQINQGYFFTEEKVVQRGTKVAIKLNHLYKLSDM